MILYPGWQALNDGLELGFVYIFTVFRLGDVSCSELCSEQCSSFNGMIPQLTMYY